MNEPRIFVWLRERGKERVINLKPRVHPALGVETSHGVVHGIFVQPIESTSLRCGISASLQSPQFLTERIWDGNLRAKFTMQSDTPVGQREARNVPVSPRQENRLRDGSDSQNFSKKSKRTLKQFLREGCPVTRMDCVAFHGCAAEHHRNDEHGQHLTMQKVFDHRGDHKLKIFWGFFCFSVVSSPLQPSGLQIALKLCAHEAVLVPPVAVKNALSQIEMKFSCDEKKEGKKETASYFWALQNFVSGQTREKILYLFVLCCCRQTRYWVCESWETRWFTLGLHVNK